MKKGGTEAPPLGRASIDKLPLPEEVDDVRWPRLLYLELG